MTNNENEKVPLFRTWRGWYILVLVVLVLLILVFWQVTVHFA